jgi:hypothetical protein
VSNRTPNLGSCGLCGVPLLGKRPDAAFCSDRCYDRRKRNPATQRACAFCGTAFPLRDLSDSNRRYCSRQCAKNASAKKVAQWKLDHPGYMEPYNARRLAKNPGAWVEKSRANRAEALRLLGGKCVVCGVSNPAWLHIDFVPGSKGLRYRHSRGIAFVRRNLSFFRILCANHHYELTLTGRIECCCNE